MKGAKSAKPSGGTAQLVAAVQDRSVPKGADE